MTLTEARVIRASDTTMEVPLQAAATTRSARIVRREQVEAEARAAHILARAEEDAEQCRREAEQASAQARARATDEGYKEGLARAARDVVERIALEQKHDARASERLVQLATLLAERLVGRALQMDHSLVRDMALTLLGEVRGARRITFRCNPQDVPELERAVTGFASHAEIHVQGTPELRPGDFRLTTDVGTLDGSLGSRLELLARKLAEGLRE